MPFPSSKSFCRAPAAMSHGASCGSIAPSSGCRSSRRPNAPRAIYLKRFYYDCIIESPQIVMDLIRLVGADRVLFGTDYPSPMRDARPTEFIQGLAELSQSERDAILGGNAARAFGL